MVVTPVIATNDLTCRFGNTLAVDHLTLNVQPGEVFGFLGHNGAGKTTTVRLLNGVLSPSEGYAKVLGLDPMIDGPILRRHTGVLTETPSLDERLTARENLTIYADIYDVPSQDVAARVNELIEAFELTDRADDKVGSYSKGMKQRMALARTLLHNPDILFLDEPTAGLDPVAIRHVHELITRLSREEGRTVFLCTHNLAEAQMLCDRVAVLQHGRVLALGTPSELANRIEGNQRLDIEIDPKGSGLARKALAVFPDLTIVSFDKDIITVQGADREIIPALLESLVMTGVRVYRVTPQEPSLEDIYFALYEKKEVSI